MPALVVVLALGTAWGAPATQREAELAAVREEITRLSQRLATAQRRSRSLAEELREAEIGLALQESRVQEARLAYELSLERTRESEAAVQELDEKLGRLRDSLRDHLVVLYGLGRQRTLRLLLSMEPGGDLLSAVRQLRFLARRDAVALEQYEDTARRLFQEHEALRVEKGRLVSWLRREEERNAALAEARERHGRLAAEAEAVRRRLESRSSELRQREERLARLIELLAEDDDGAFAASGIQEFRGVLDWPLDGDVVTDFGARLDPRYRTRVPHNGIAIAPAKGRRVRAVYAGKVLFAAPFQGFGPTVVVQHPRSVLSLYAGLSELTVEKGGVVSLGDVLGSVDGELYFELREDNRAVDPLEWLR